MTVRALKTSALRGSIGLLLLCLTSAELLGRDASSQPAQTNALKVVELREPDAQILSYRHLGASTEVHMRGTKLAPEARVKIKIGSRPGFVELDINRGGISGLKPAYRLGKDFLTYVLWAVSVDGRASNLGEITFEGEDAVAVNVTTPYQTFWLMVTAEPNYAVVDPSTRMVLYSVKQGSTSQTRAIPVSGDLFYFTHYSTYESSSGEAPVVPNQLLQARKAMELANKSVARVPPHSGSAPKEEQYTRQALNQAKSFLVLAEDAYKRDPRGRDVIQFARTSAQSAENARALATGVVGGVRDRQLENELLTVRAELERLQAAAPPAADSSDDDPAVTPPPPPPDVAVQSSATPLLKQPALWFAAGGWALAIVLLFRRRSG